MQLDLYSAESIQVLTGLEPVRKRPGMYTDTSCPNHLLQEVVDNSVDEVLANAARHIQVSLLKDNVVQVSDDGRGMPVDVHPEHGVPGVELILTRLHAGGKFNSDSYKFSGGLHGVGVSVVNALSAWLEVEVCRDGQRYHMRFEQGEKTSDLAVLGSVGKRNTGTVLRFLPDAGYFDAPNISRTWLKHLLRAKAVLCPGLEVSLHDESGSKTETCSWHYEAGIGDYLAEHSNRWQPLLQEPFMHCATGGDETVEWALQWLPEAGELLTESYVNLIPTIGGGSHVSGLRSGLLDALKEFCELRNLLPRGIKLSAEDLWSRCAFVLSLKMHEPQFSGQTKERLTSRQAATFVSGVARDAFSLWLNQHTDAGEKLADLAIASARNRMQNAKKVARKKATSGPALPGKLADCSGVDVQQAELFLVEGDSAGGSAKQARDREFQAILPLRGKILNTWEVSVSELLASQEVHNIAVAVGVEPGSSDLSGLRYGKVCILADADSDGLHIATLLCALFVRHFPRLVSAGHVYVAMPPLYRIDVGKEVYYALDDAEKQAHMDAIAAEKKQGKVTVQRFKGLGEMSAGQLRETTMAPQTRRLVRLTMQQEDDTCSLLDMLLARKRAPERRSWLEANGDQAGLGV